jgi:hypothetical protein
MIRYFLKAGKIQTSVLTIACFLYILSCPAHIDPKNATGVGVVTINFGSTDIYQRKVSLYEDAEGKIIYCSVARGYEQLDSLKLVPFEIIYPIHSLCFRCLADSAGMFKIVLNETTGKAGWIKKEKYAELKSWLNYFKGSDYVVTSGKLLQRPDNAAKEVKEKHLCNTYTLLSMEGDWAELESNSYCDQDGETDQKQVKGWVKWKEGDLLKIQKMYNE